MTITINLYVVYTWLFIIVFETIYSYVTLRKAFEEAKKMEGFSIAKMVFNSLKERPSFLLMYKRVVNPVGFLVAYIIFCLICPLVFPSSLISVFKKCIGYKSELEKKAEEEEKEIKEQEKQSERFMESEGIFSN